MTNEMKQFQRSADDLRSKAVSSIRQTIEFLFNWLIENTDIRRASEVWLTNGLWFHVFGKMKPDTMPISSVKNTGETQAPHSDYFSKQGDVKANKKFSNGRMYAANLL